MDIGITSTSVIQNSDKLPLVMLISTNYHKSKEQFLNHLMLILLITMLDSTLVNGRQCMDLMVEWHMLLLEWVEAHL